jgi:glycosyltransferase involved in cell wall biosynthesis
MKILIVDHNAVDPSHRSVYDRLSRYQNVKLRLLVPSRWFDNYRMLELERTGAPANYEMYASHVLFPGHTHRLIYVSLAKHLKEFQPDILYMNAEPENFQTFQAAMLHRWKKRGRFVFSSWRNVDYTDIGFPYKFAFLNSHIERFVLKNADHCISFNESAKQIFGQKGFSSVTVIPPYVDASFFHKIRRENLRIKMKRNGFVVGYLGRFIPEKGIDVLMKALAAASFDFTLMLVGDGPAKHDWQKLAALLGISGKIMWLPSVARSEIPQCLNCMDVVVLPSFTGTYWREQFGRILIEAMACEVPVVGSGSGEIPNVIGDAGLIFPERDLHALHERLQRLHDDTRLRNDLIQKGVERVRKNFSVETVTEQHYELFQRLMATADAAV